MKVVVLLALLGCHHAKPEARVFGGARGRFVVGAKVNIDASWNATCTDWAATFDHLIDKKDHSGEDETKPCHKKNFEITLRCSTKCDAPPLAQGIGGRASVYVIPLEVGPLTLHATSKRLDNGEVKEFEFPIDVSLPDKLELHCANRDNGSTPICGPDGVPATDPTIYPIILIDGGHAPSTLLRINGKPHPHDDTGKISLAELYPDAAVGTGIKPGTYEVTLEVGAMISKWQVVAQ